jgi:hypothetical protein
MILHLMCKRAMSVATEVDARDYRIVIGIPAVALEVGIG